MSRLLTASQSSWSPTIARTRGFKRLMPGRRWAVTIGGLVGALVVLTASAAEPEPTPQQLEFFETKVRPLLAEHCYSCHSAESTRLQAGIRVDHREGLIEGGDSGPALVPGDPDASLLVEALRYESFEMPPKGKLPDAEIAVIEHWIAIGAPWPAEPEPQAGVTVEAFDLEARKESHWAWQPIQNPDPPTVENRSWPRRELDNFVLAELERAELSASVPADRRSLIRRLYFDLIGLPPTPEQVNEVLQDSADAGSVDEAIDRLVDRLLDSPHFGERWGRHWLDLARYAESRGHEFDEDAANAHQYRDYVIRALNADVPYDQFVREQIAGDLLAEPRLHPELGFNESVLGTGFWFLGEWVHSPVDIRKDEAERFDNMIDVMSKTFLGMTVACARCHDHKFDAISAADYYALSGFLQSSDYRQVRFETEHHNREVAAKLATLDREYQQRLRPAIAAALAASLGGLERDAHGAASESDSSSKAETSQPEPQAISGRVVVDYNAIEAADFMQDGVIYGHAPRQAGDLILRSEANPPSVTVAPYTAAVNDAFWDGLSSQNDPAVNRRGKLTELPRSGRTLRTPTFELGADAVNCQVRGSGHIVACVDSHRLVAGPLHGETVQRVEASKGDRVRWVSLPLSRYVGHRLHLEFVPDEGKKLEVLRVVAGHVAEGEFASAEAASSTAELQRPADEILAEAIDVWSKGELAAHRNGTKLAAALRWAISNDQSWREMKTERGATVAEELARWSQERENLRGERRLESRLAIAMMDGSGENDRLLIRGSVSNPGEEVPRRFLTAIDGEQPLRIDQGSGRLELAARINAPDNPLTSRVIVNRIWHHLMGRGIVPTTDDFGVLGQRPTHPDLLDHLASWFDHNGRSIKHTIRYITSSSTYRMSSQLHGEAAQQDPKNLLWHHVPPKRLQGEVIRDSILALTGTLDRTMHGPAVPIHLTSFMDGRGRPGTSGPLDGDRRRSIYTAVRRNFLSPFMLAFDSPVPFSTMGRRNVSNVPAQALILMNDPLVAECSRQWAQRALSESPSVIEGRVAWMYETAFARPPTPEEMAVAVAFVRGEMTERETDADDPDIWADLAHALINTKEFIFLK
jgi:cytochrome c553